MAASRGCCFRIAFPARREPSHEREPHRLRPCRPCPGPRGVRHVAYLPGHGGSGSGRPVPRAVQARGAQGRAQARPCHHLRAVPPGPRGRRERPAERGADPACVRPARDDPEGDRTGQGRRSRGGNVAGDRARQHRRARARPRLRSPQRTPPLRRHRFRRPVDFQRRRRLVGSQLRLPAQPVHLDDRRRSGAAGHDVSRHGRGERGPGRPGGVQEHGRRPHLGLPPRHQRGREPRLALREPPRHPPDADGHAPRGDDEQQPHPRRDLPLDRCRCLVDARRGDEGPRHRLRPEHARERGGRPRRRHHRLLARRRRHVDALGAPRHRHAHGAAGDGTRGDRLRAIDARPRVRLARQQQGRGLEVHRCRRQLDEARDTGAPQRAGRLRQRHLGRSARLERGRGRWPRHLPLDGRRPHVREGERVADLPQLAASGPPCLRLAAGLRPRQPRPLQRQRRRRLQDLRHPRRARRLGRRLVARQQRARGHAVLLRAPGAPPRAAASSAARRTTARCSSTSATGASTAAATAASRRWTRSRTR